MKDGVPELPSEDTPNEEVLNVLFFLVAKRASSRMRETSPSHNLSAVQHRLWATSHIKNRHLGGAQVFQMRAYGSKWIAP